MTKFIAVAALLVSQSLISLASADPVTKQVGLSVHDVLVPEKVEYNNDAKIVVSGMFPNSCYRWSHAEVTDVNALNHHIRGIATVTQTMCLMVLVPFTKEINLGKLQRGEHTLRVINGDDTFFERTLLVE